MKINFWKNHQSPAFSLLEVISVLFIVAVGMVGTMSLIIQSIQTGQVNRGNLIACQLAQEGIELIRGTRDNNWQASQPWLTGLSDGNYKMDYSMATPTPITLTSQGVMLFENNYYRNYHGAETPNPSLVTGFYRVINLQASSTSTSTLQVQSNVSWSDRGKTFTCNLYTLLYDWR